MQGYDIEAAVSFIAAAMRREGVRAKAEELESFIRRAIDADFAFMQENEVLTEDGMMGLGEYDEDDAFEAILDMLLDLRDETGMTIIFITHDIGLAYYISDTVYIMEHGRFVESGKADEVILHPKAAYTKRLISDVPKIHEEWDLSTVDLLAKEE